jgi:hypothetical protein
LRARGKGLNIDAQSAQFLAERTEGNLLAADQELEKLSIRFAGQDAVDFATIEDSVARSARYSHFLLVDACLAGNRAVALGPAEFVTAARPVEAGRTQRFAGRTQLAAVTNLAQQAAPLPARDGAPGRRTD